MKRKLFLTLSLTILANCIILAQPDLTCVWGSTYGLINWQEGWYGNKTKTISGSLSLEGDKYVYRGRWGRTNDTKKSGTVVFNFGSNSSFIGHYTSGNSTTKTQWTGQGACGNSDEGTIASQDDNDQDANSVQDCLDYMKTISDVQSKIKKESVEFNKLFSEVEKFDKSTRLNFCTKTIDHYSDVGILEFDDSWSNYLSNLNTKLGYFGQAIALINTPIAVLLGPLVGKVGKLISYLVLIFDALETEQLPVDQAIEEYNKIRKTREQVIGDLIKILQLYYCDQILEYDTQLHDLYNNIIPNSTICNEFEKNQLRQQITRDRPNGLPSAIWIKHIYQRELENCNKL